MLRRFLCGFVWGLEFGACRFERGKGLEFGALDSGRNGVNLGRDEFSKQNGVSQSTNDESGIRGAKSCSSRI